MSERKRGGGERQTVRERGEREREIESEREREFIKGGGVSW